MLGMLQSSTISFEQLVEYCKTNNVEAVRAALTSSNLCDLLTCEDANRRTPLHYAFQHEDKTLLFLLAKHPKFPFQAKITPQGPTFLEWAIKDADSPSLVDYIRTMRGDINATCDGWDYCNLFHMALEYQRNDIVEALLERPDLNPNVLTRKNCNLLTPLQYALRTNPAMAERLMKDPRTQLQFKETKFCILDAATSLVQDKYVKPEIKASCLRILHSLAKGERKDLNLHAEVWSPLGHRLLHWAYKYEHDAILKALIENKDHYLKQSAGNLEGLYQWRVVTYALEKFPAMAEELVKNPRIKLQLKDLRLCILFHIADEIDKHSLSVEQKASCWRILLSLAKGERKDVNLDTVLFANGETLMHWAAKDHADEEVKAYKEEILDALLRNPTVKPYIKNWQDATPLNIAQPKEAAMILLAYAKRGISITNEQGDNGNKQVQEWIELYQTNRDACVATLREYLMKTLSHAAHVFAQVVFASDGYTSVTKNSLSGEEKNAQTFFNITTRLPMELQMAVCNRVGGSMRAHVPVKDTELALQKEAKILSTQDAAKQGPSPRPSCNYVTMGVGAAVAVTAALAAAVLSV